MKKTTFFFNILGLSLIAGAGALIISCDNKKAQPIKLEENNNFRPITLSDNLLTNGLRIDRVILDEKTPSCNLYIKFLKYFNSTVLLKAFDKSGLEIGRVSQLVSGETEDANYFKFYFDDIVPLKTSASYFTLEISTKNTNKIEPVQIPEKLDTPPTKKENSNTQADSIKNETTLSSETKTTREDPSSIVTLTPEKEIQKTEAQNNK